MAHPTRDRRFSLIAALGVLLIGIAVFGWGLYYKLSLYQGPQSVSHLAPHAKLLSQKERAVLPQGLAADGSLDEAIATQMRPAADFPAVLLALSLAVLALLSVTNRADEARTTSMPWHLSRGCCTYFFFRPPPVQI